LKLLWVNPSSTSFSPVHANRVAIQLPPLAGLGWQQLPLKPQSNNTPYGTEQKKKTVSCVFYLKDFLEKVSTLRPLLQLLLLFDWRGEK
jgi:hypothetical protein